MNHNCFKQMMTFFYIPAYLMIIAYFDKFKYLLFIQTNKNYVLFIKTNNDLI